MSFLFLIAVILLIVTFLVIFPKFGIWSIVILSILQVSYLTRLTGGVNFPKQIAWLPFLLTAILFLPMLAKHAIYKEDDSNRITPLKVFGVFTVLLFCLLGISAFINETPFLTGIFGIRYLLLIPFLAALIFTFNTPSNSIKYYMQFVVWIGLFQFPITLLQRFIFSTRQVGFSGDARDLISGTFSSYGILSFTQLLAFTFLISYWVRKGESLVLKNILVPAIILLSPIFISNSRASVLFLFVIVASLLVRYKQFIFTKKFSRYILTMVFLIVVGTTMIFARYQQSDYGRDLKTQYSWDYMKEYLFRSNRNITEYKEWGGDPRMGRGASIITAYQLIEKKGLTFFLGLGPGSTQQSLVFGTDGKYYEKYGLLSGLGRTQLSLTLAELGFLGVFLFLGLFMFLHKTISNINSADLSSMYLFQDVFFFLVVNIILYSTYFQLFFNFAIIFYVSFFVAVLQKGIQNNGGSHNYENV